VKGQNYVHPSLRQSHVYNDTVKVREIYLIIIGVGGNVRNESLRSPSFQKLFYGCKIFEALTPSDLGCDIQSLDHKHLSGISCYEFAASVSHQAARNLSLTYDPEWILILEDDAVTSCNFDSEIFKLLDEFSLFDQDPIAIHLFPEQYGILKRFKDDSYSVKMIPDYAVGYLMNKCAVDYAANYSNEVHNYLADWPRYFNSIPWYASRASLVSHPSPSEESLADYSRIEPGRLRRKNDRHFTQKVLSEDLFRLIKFKAASLFSSRLYGTAYIQASKMRSMVIGKYCDEK